MSGERIHLSLDDETATILEEMEEHIDNNFGGKSAFFRTMIKDYSEEGAAEAQVKAIKRKIRKKKNELEFLEKELKTWERELEEEKKENKAESINERIEELKAKKDDLEKEIKTEEQLRQKAKNLYSGKDWDEDRIQEAIEDWVDRKMTRNQGKREQIRDLENQIQKLKNKEVVA